MSAAKPKIATAPAPRVSIFAFMVGGVLLIAAVAVAAFLLRGSVEIAVPRHKIAAFEQIDSGDIMTKSVRRQGAGDSDFHTAAELEGRIARRDLAAGEAIPTTATTPAVDGEVGSVRLELQPERAAALGLEAGDRVLLLLSPTSRRLQPISVEALVLDLPDGDDDAEQTYLVALDSGDAVRLLGALGRSRLLIARAG